MRKQTTSKVPQVRGKRRSVSPSAESLAPVAPVGARDIVFITHATPEDNAFTMWLGAKLTALGYDVWADVLQLRGGDDWERQLEKTLRHRAVKVLFVATPAAVTKQGVRNELRIATDVAKHIADNEFIIPLRLADFEAPFSVAQAHYIDFSKNWIAGLKELLPTLRDTYRVPRKTDLDSYLWREIQLSAGTTPALVPETLSSNWLEIKSFPKQLHYYTYRGSVNVDTMADVVRRSPWPCVPHLRGFLSYASVDQLQPDFPVALDLVESVTPDCFARQGWVTRSIQAYDARNILTNLHRKAFERLFLARGLEATPMSGNKTVWWPPLGVAPTAMVTFRWGDVSGRRQIQGVSEARHAHWHFGVTFVAKSSPFDHVLALSTIIFTQDGRTPVARSRRHGLRRSFTKTWRNARWRDMLHAFLFWLGAGTDTIAFPVGNDDALTVALPPLRLVSPVSIVGDSQEPDDESDADELESESAYMDEGDDDELDWSADDE